MTNSAAWAIIETAGYARALKKFLRKHPDLRQAHAQIITLLHENPFHPALKLHGLHGAYADIQADSITYSYRMTMTIAIVEREIVLLDIGSHDDVYR